MRPGPGSLVDLFFLLGPGPRPAQEEEEETLEPGHVISRKETEITVPAPGLQELI